MELTCCRTPRRPGASTSRQAVVECAEAYMRAHVSTPVSLSRLCRVVGRSERGLRNAFYGVHGMSPTRWMLAERLERVRRALSDPRIGPATVTRVATEYGFYELGRFAGRYRKAFGEAPSATLRGASRNSAPRNTEQERAH